MVEIVESCMVVPSEATPKHKLWLSNLDIVATRGHVPTLHVYQSTTDYSTFFCVETVKAALAKTLAIYYPLAGKLAVDESGRMEVHCTGEGALFVVAKSDGYTIDDVTDVVPTVEMRRMFVPSAASSEPPCIVLMVQVTFLRCGGVILGVANHHGVADGRSAFQFIKTWSAVCRGLDAPPSSPPPSFDRTILSARSPPSSVGPYEHPDYAVPNSSPAADADANADAAPFVVELFTLSKAQLDSLKLRYGGGGNPSSISTFRAVATHAWRCACIARALRPGETTELHTIVTVCDRLNPPLPPHFFGNATVRVKVSAPAEELISNPSKSGAEQIRSVINQVDDEYVRSVIDRAAVTGASGHQKKGSSSHQLRQTDLRLASWLGLPIYDADFGWGEPRCVLRAHVFGSGHGYMVRRRGKDGGVGLTMALEPENMEKFKQLFYEEVEIN
ncbi:hydroxycinnamoyltransferase 4-like [Ananas comosus]|uniref:Hydroxycinnamoyltransferase 4-like n=1 Tax=Ananas comosus TaxID=4615 RepID=A0A199UXK0_ANACO|nr:hydroxycinnamoyltransferase 4-like [Ananas comosus]OAY69360.1 Shikimate O-hydroxycinnamoyltransferase [Ananas comosus]